MHLSNLKISISIIALKFQKCGAWQYECHSLYSNDLSNSYAVSSFSLLHSALNVGLRTYSEYSPSAYEMSIKTRANEPFKSITSLLFGAIQIRSLLKILLTLTK